VRNTRRLWISVGFVVALVAASGAGFATDRLEPVLGLDLEGGVSVILKAPAGTPEGVLEEAVENIRNRVDAVGVAEPDVFVTGTNIEVQLPGLAKGAVETRPEELTCLIGRQRAEFGCFGTEAAAQAALDELSVEEQVVQVCIAGEDVTGSQCFPTEEAATAAIAAIEPAKQREGEDEGRFCLLDPAGASFGCYDTKAEAEQAKESLATETTSEFCLVGEEGQSLPCFDAEEDADAALAAISLTPVDSRFCVVSSAGVELGCFVSRDAAEARLQQTGQERLLELIGTTARLEQREVIQEIPQGTPEFETTPLTCGTPAEADSPDCTFEALADQTVVFQGTDPGTGVPTKYRLGPVEITGDRLARATAVLRGPGQTQLTSEWVVEFELDDEGAKIFGDVTTALVGKQLAIVLDREVISAPVINEPITGGRGEISGAFTEDEAKRLSTVLNAGALPVQLEQQNVQTVSPTLGRESLRQGIVAGIGGLVALFAYLLFYYRLLGVVAWFGMSMWAVLALALVSVAGDAFGYSLTLAGVAGLVISLGVTADSYIVFFERLKDEVRSGRSARSAVVPAFKRAFKTIVAADVVTGIAALVLYVTAVSSVRGFALTLGVATALDLFVVYFFKRPTVFLIARSERLVNLRGFGLTSGVAGDGETVPEGAA
jgi:preprotein translocase subunit SecD